MSLPLTEVAIASEMLKILRKPENWGKGSVMIAKKNGCGFAHCLDGARNIADHGDANYVRIRTPGAKYRKPSQAVLERIVKTFNSNPERYNRRRVYFGSWGQLTWKIQGEYRNASRTSLIGINDEWGTEHQHIVLLLKDTISSLKKEQKSSRG